MSAKAGLILNAITADHPLRSHCRALVEPVREDPECAAGYGYAGFSITGGWKHLEWGRGDLHGVEPIFQRLCWLAMEVHGQRAQRDCRARGLAFAGSDIRHAVPITLR